ncbi:hypothetical protein BHE74_00056791 [Ensete ventricosum]|nr:hypothetical protein BHE74_00056791 [Ensete ventricosum]
MKFTFLRMSKLLDNAIEQDEIFWNQDALKEEENDENYEEEVEVADEFDSDFNEDVRHTGPYRQTEIWLVRYEIMNLRNLERVLAREEEVKKKAVVHKAVYDGPQIRFTSRNGESYLEFIKGASFQSEIRTSSVPCK